MGFQSSFNQLLATASTGALGARHIKEQNKATEIAARNEKIFAGEEYQKEYDSSKKLSQEIISHNKQVDSINKGTAALNEKAIQGKMSRKAYEKAFQEQLEKGSMLYDQNQDLIARKKILEERILANKDNIIKQGYGNSPITLIPSIMDMRNSGLLHLGKNDANWKKPGRPKKEVN